MTKLTKLLTFAIAAMIFFPAAHAENVRIKVPNIICKVYTANADTGDFSQGAQYLLFPQGILMEAASDRDGHFIEYAFKTIEDKPRRQWAPHWNLKTGESKNASDVRWTGFVLETVTIGPASAIAGMGPVKRNVFGIATDGTSAWRVDKKQPQEVFRLEGAGCPRGRKALNFLKDYQIIPPAGEAYR